MNQNIKLDAYFWKTMNKFSSYLSSLQFGITLLTCPHQTNPARMNVITLKLQQRSVLGD